MLFLLLGAAAAGGWLYHDYQGFLAAPLRTTPNATLTVPSGASIKRIAQELAQRGVIDSALYLQLYARLNQLANRIQAGEYALTAELTPPALLASLAAGNVIQYSLTVPEGWTFRQLLAALHTHPQITRSLQDLSPAAVMARLGYSGEHPEGRFFPDTYHFPKNTTDLEFLQRAYQTMAQKLAATWAQRAPGLPLNTPYEALIMASLIEKETGVDHERAQIAGVFTRRLQKSMLLQTDPTVIYGLGEAYDGNLRRRDLQRDTPYNTYTRPGLPPTPIALPGVAALRAALNPAPGQELYFVAKGDGSHAFSATLAEHNQAVRHYQLKRH